MSERENNERFSNWMDGYSPDWRQYFSPGDIAPLHNAFMAGCAAASIAPPTEQEIAAYRDLFRVELAKRMDTKHPSASPSTESHAIALRRFVDARNAGARPDRTAPKEKPAAQPIEWPFRREPMP